MPLSLLGALSLALVAGCDGGPDFATRLRVSNRCDVDLAVVFDPAPAPAPAWTTTEEVDRIGSGQTKTWLVEPISASSDGLEYMWITTPGSASWGEPAELNLRDLPESEGSGGTPERLLVIEGDMCP